MSRNWERTLVGRESKSSKIFDVGSYLIMVLVLSTNAGEVKSAVIVDLDFYRNQPPPANPDDPHAVADARELYNNMVFMLPNGLVRCVSTIMDLWTI